MILAISYEGVKHIYIKQLTSKNRGINSQDFILFMKELKRTITDGDSVILDNASIHRESSVLKCFEELQITTHFQAPYSPDLSPIELVFSWVKKRLKHFNNSGLSLFYLIGRVTLSCPIQIIRNYIAHCMKRIEILSKEDYTKLMN